MRLAEIRQLSDTALQTELEKLSENLRNMRFQEAIGPLENPLLMRNTRREISRIRTVMRETAALRAGESK